MTAGRMAWAADSRTVFYPVIDPETLRSYKVMRHGLGTAAAADVAVYEEKDETFDVEIGLSRSRRYLILACSSTLSNEYRILDAAKPDGDFAVFQERVRGLEYSVDHLAGRFYVLTNDGAVNFRLMEAGEDKTGREHWRELIAHRPDVLLRGLRTFQRPPGPERTPRRPDPDPRPALGRRRRATRSISPSRPSWPIPPSPPSPTPT